MYPRNYPKPENLSVFLFGPRGTGKTTWLKANFPNAQRLDLLDSEIFRLLLANPARLEGMIRFSQSPLVIIDEVQKVPALLDEVHRLIEEKKLNFILTGSSARKLKRGSANLLAGRARQRFFFPLTAWELGSDFDMGRALRFGLLPTVWNISDPKQYLSSYTNTYLREEVQAEALTRNLEKFSRFLEVMSFSQAEPINMSNIARDVGVDSKVVASYLEILEDLLLSVRIPVFSRKAKRRLVHRPKFFFFDSGIFRALRPKGPLDDEAELDGPSLETLFFHHHRALGEFLQWDQQLFYWRSADKVEIDFVSYGPRGLFAFEIKRTSMLREVDLKGLKLFKKDYPIAKAFLLYGGERNLHQDGIEIMNFEKAILNLANLFEA